MARVWRFDIRSSKTASIFCHRGYVAVSAERSSLVAHWTAVVICSNVRVTLLYGIRPYGTGSYGRSRVRAETGLFETCPTTCPSRDANHDVALRPTWRRRDDVPRMCREAQYCLSRPVLREGCRIEPGLIFASVVICALRHRMPAEIACRDGLMVSFSPLLS